MVVDRENKHNTTNTRERINMDNMEEYLKVQDSEDKMERERQEFLDDWEMIFQQCSVCNKPLKEKCTCRTHLTKEEWHMMEEEKQIKKRRENTELPF
jgi:hypothetical protein